MLDMTTSPHVFKAGHAPAGKYVRQERRAGLARPCCARRAIAHALVTGDVTAIADGYVALAEALMHERQPEEALRELEEGLDMLTAGHADHAREGHRLVVALAALSRRLGVVRSHRRTRRAVR